MNSCDFQDMEHQQQSDADLVDAQFRDLEKSLEAERVARKNVEADYYSQTHVSRAIIARFLFFYTFPCSWLPLQRTRFPGRDINWQRFSKSVMMKLAR